MREQRKKLSGIWFGPWRWMVPAVVSAGLAWAASIAETDTAPQEDQAEQAAASVAQEPVAVAEEQGTPGIRLREARIDEVIESLRAFSRRADPEEHGVNFIYQGPPVEDVPRLTLNLRNVTLKDAIRHITSAAGLSYRIEPNAVIITSRDAPQGEIITRIYPVQPTIMDAVRGQERRGGGDRVEDLFRW